jgi:hypothetical protein
MEQHVGRSSSPSTRGRLLRLGLHPPRVVLRRRHAGADDRRGLALLRGRRVTRAGPAVCQALMTRGGVAHRDHRPTGDPHHRVRVQAGPIALSPSRLFVRQRPPSPVPSATPTPPTSVSILKFIERNWACRCRRRCCPRAAWTGCRTRRRAPPTPACRPTAPRSEICTTCSTSTKSRPSQPRYRLPGRCRPARRGSTSRRSSADGAQQWGPGADGALGAAHGAAGSGQLG